MHNFCIFIFILMAATNSLSFLFTNHAAEFCSHCFFHGIDIFYSYLNLSDVIIFNVFYLFFDNLFSDNFNYFFFFFWVKSLYFDSFQLYSVLFLDLNYKLDFFNFFFLNSWYKSYLFSNCFSFLFTTHTELLFIKFNLINYFFNNYFFNFHAVLNLRENYESYLFCFNYFFNLLLLFLFLTIFILFYFSFYNNYYSNGAAIEYDYINSSFLVEAEKEITSLDDIILSLFLILNIFGWYFFFNFWYIFIILPEMVFVILFVFFLYYLIIGIPTFLIFDFGIFFLVYLRGVGDKSNLVYELMFDYIAVIIFYTRILVQGIRLVLMLFTYASMHDLILFFYFGNGFFVNLDDAVSNLNVIFSSFESFSYFFFFKIFGIIFYWIYEILHTFFVVTVQFSAFFAIVFWLFLFLYTFFVLEKNENYFFEKRKKI